MPISVGDAVRAALALLEADGLDKLTVRRVATELGVKAPALYWHFTNKRALLDHMADAIVAPVIAQLPAPGTPWLKWLEDAGFALRAALLSHRDGPRVALGADLRVARALGEFAERTVEVLHRAGFPLADATRAAGVLVHFILGRAVEEQTMPDRSDEVAVISTIPFPLMARGMRERHAAGTTAADNFRYALGILLAGLNATRPT
ncbi:TetR/AcrR family transcriptional regulator C-terminal domain-containing protein [Amycolatopsis nigrescens]|uniref:TetR/AcrR family transcriptional regulator C-terminal domain-containing protein n=1 Tax=Amycolatopsis nigrescens TaxID=381445 RepID=UPI0003766C6A|nr:TetR/AcrR family transcriptional regulator C-terminal domain-containing protein [Amycolatopsis nigrescens]